MRGRVGAGGSRGGTDPHRPSEAGSGRRGIPRPRHRGIAEERRLGFLQMLVGLSWIFMAPTPPPPVGPILTSLEHRLPGLSEETPLAAVPIFVDFQTSFTKGKNKLSF